MSLQRIEAILREQYETGAHGTRHLVLGLDVYDAITRRAVPAPTKPGGYLGDKLDALMSIPVIVADEGTLEPTAWRLCGNAFRVVVEDGEMGTDPECQHATRTLEITQRRGGGLRFACLTCGAEWLEGR